MPLAVTARRVPLSIAEETFVMATRDVVSWIRYSIWLFGESIVKGVMNGWMMNEGRLTKL